MRTEAGCSCDVGRCSARVTGHMAEVAQRLAAGGWCRLRIEAIAGSQWATLCLEHARALGLGERGSLWVQSGGWTEDLPMARSRALAEDLAECAVERCPECADVGGAGDWSELRLEAVALPGASYVCRLCPAHARALFAGTRLTLAADRWTEDAATTRAIAALFTAR